MGILIKTSGEKLEVNPADGESFSLKEVQDYVGGYVEIFRVGEKKYLFNEEGLLLDLPTNTKATEELEIIFNGEPINIAFNPQYLTDGLQAIGTPFVQINFTGGSKPAVLTGKHELNRVRDLSYQYLLMPMRFSA